MWCDVVADGSVSGQSYIVAATGLKLEGGAVVACHGWLANYGTRHAKIVFASRPDV